MFWPFKRYDVEMSPPVAGRITEDGRPIAGITVTRVLYYQGYKDAQDQVHSVVTDEDGRFKFKSMTVRSRYPGDIFGQNFPVVQRVAVSMGSQEHYLWATSKWVEPLPTISRLLSELECDLKSPEYHHEIDLRSEGGKGSQAIISSCLWERFLMKTYVKDENSDTYIELNTQGEN